MSELPTEAPTFESTMPKQEEPKKMETPISDALWSNMKPKAPPQKKPSGATSTHGVKDKNTGGIMYDTSKKSHLILVSEILKNRGG